MADPDVMDDPSELHDCPKDGCEKRLPRSVLACPQHWNALPLELRKRINRTWNRGDISAYMKARGEAVAVLNGEAT